MKDLNHYCIACMEDTKGEAICPHCGSAQDTPQDEPLLPVRTVLAQRYLVGLELHSNSEGICYIGYDMVNNMIIMIREFLPDGLVTRKNGALNIIINPARERTFHRLYTSFMESNRAIAHMREVSAIIPVYDIFEENGTAYTISELPETITLREFIKNNGGQISWQVARPLFMPILSALSSMAAVGFNHLAVTPDNLVITTNGKMKMTGFGIPAVRRVGLGLEPELYTGCSALEQYSDEEPVGEVTDIYGFCACLFFALVGKLPYNASKRISDSRLLIPTSVLRSLPQHVVSALANGLQVFQLKRTQTFERLRDELTLAPSINHNNNAGIDARANRRQAAYREEDEYRKPYRKKKASGAVYGIVSCIVSLVVLIIVGIAILGNSNEDNSGNSASDPNVPSSTVSDTVSGDGSVSVASIEAPTGLPVQVPDLTGKTLKEVQGSQDYKDFQILTGESAYNDAVKEGEIFSQDPEPGTVAYPGAVIAVRLSNGKTLRKLPKIAGKSVDDARLEIAKAGLECGTVSYQTSTSISPGLVIGYRGNVNAGDEIAAGSFVDIIVSEEKNSSSQAQSR